MKNLVVAYSFYILFCCIVGFCLMPSVLGKPLSEISANLVLDQNYVDFLNNQMETDGADQMILWADTIALAENVDFLQVNLIIVCNIFDPQGHQLRVLPDTNRYVGFNGVKGSKIEIIAKKIDGELRVYLPGGKGLDGQNGKNGKDGNPKEAKPTASGFSLGSRGENGDPGGNGGKGGELTVHTFSDSSFTVSLIAPGGDPGAGGDPGKGGISYVPKVAKIINPGRPNQRTIYRVVSIRELDGEEGLLGERGFPGKSEVQLINELEFEFYLDSFFQGGAEFLAQSGWQITLIQKPN